MILTFTYWFWRRVDTLAWTIRRHIDLTEWADKHEDRQYCAWYRRTFSDTT